MRRPKCFWETVYIYKTVATDTLLLLSPGHQYRWCSICSIKRFLSSLWFQVPAPSQCPEMIEYQCLKLMVAPGDQNLGWTSWIWTWTSKTYNRLYKEENFLNISGRLRENFSLKHWNMHMYSYVSGLGPDCSNSSANALELLQSCTKPSMFPTKKISM